MLTGGVPHTLSRCTELRKLILCHNKIGGFFPEALHRCSRLEHFDVSFNKFEGELPAAVREMPALAVCVIENAFAIDDDN